MDTAEGVVDPGAKFQATRQRAVDAGNKALTGISAALTLGARHAAEPGLKDLDFLFDVVAMADAATRLAQQAKLPSEGAAPAEAEYLVSSLFLADCAEYLLGDSHGRERLCLVTGSRRGTMRTLERMVQVALSEQSTTCAVANHLDLTQKLIAMDATWGHHLHGLFHSHPGQGRGATGPSGTDLTTHQQHERGGYPLVSAIFERSGFIRFFRYDRTFTITVYGKGVEQYEEHLFKIGNVSHDTSWRGGHWLGNRDRTAGELERD